MIYTHLEFIPTGNIFVLPKEEADRIKRDDRGNNYRILGEDNQPIEEPKVEVKEKTIAEIVTGEPIEKKEIVLLRKDKNGKDVPIMPVEQMDKQMVIALGKRLGLPKFHNQMRKEVMVDRLKEYFGEN